jgi:hypothetical protein
MSCNNVSYFHIRQPSSFKILSHVEEYSGTCECGNETSGSIKCAEFLDQLKSSWLLKDSASWSKLQNISIIYVFNNIII